MQREERRKQEDYEDREALRKKRMVIDCVYNRI